MSTLRRIILVTVLAVVVLGLVPAFAAAAPPGGLARTRDKITAAKKQKATLDDQLARLGDQIGVVEQKLTTTRAKLEILQEQLRLKRLELQAAERSSPSN